MKYEIGKCSDIGLVRSSNEDSLISLNLEHKSASATRIGLYAVADGLGGYKGGDIASKTALQVLNNNISKYFLSTPYHFPPIKSCNSCSCKIQVLFLK